MPTSTNHTAQEQGERLIQRVGGALAVIGGLGYFITLLLHGDLPDQTTEIALAHIAERPEWRGLKLMLIASVFCWLAAFLALSDALASGMVRLLSRWAVAGMIVGVSVMVVEYAIIGHALKVVADTWQGAAGTQREEHVRLAEMMLAITGGLFHSFVAWLLGLPFVLMGLAMVLGGRYPSWLGWVPVVGGAGALLAGTTRFLGLAVVPYPLLYGAFVIPLCLWLAGIGMLMWYRAGVPLDGLSFRQARPASPPGK